MKQLVLRKELTANAETMFSFSKRVKTYLVKNFTEGAILVSFESGTPDNECIKILGKSYQEVIINTDQTQIDYLENGIYHTCNCLFIKAEQAGEVEVQALCYANQ